MAAETSIIGGEVASELGLADERTLRMRKFNGSHALSDHNC
jgi:hypothetical protein